MVDLLNTRGSDYSKKMQSNPGVDILRKRQRFTDHDDLTLLREVLGQNPYESPALWETIQENMASVTGKQFNLRTLKEHLDRLIKIWMKQSKILKDKSGIEVTETEKDILCGSIFGLMQEFKRGKTEKKNDLDIKKQGIEARNRWADVSLDRSFKDVQWSMPVATDHESLARTPEVQEEIIIHFTDEDEVTDPATEESQEETVVNTNTENAEPTVAVTEPVTLTSQTTPKLKPMQTGKLNNATKTSNTSRVLGAVRSRKRKINTQRQGLAYLEEYDKQQAKLKGQELELEEKKLILEEKKIILEERRVTLHENHLRLIEFEIKKNFELQEKKLYFEIENRKNLEKIIERQDNLLHLLLSKFV